MSIQFLHMYCMLMLSIEVLKNREQIVKLLVSEDCTPAPFGLFAQLYNTKVLLCFSVTIHICCDVFFGRKRCVIYLLCILLCVIFI